MRNSLMAAALFASLLAVPTVANADDTTTGIVGGAVAGAVVGGPVGAVVGGAVGGTVGAASDENRREQRREERSMDSPVPPSSDTTTCRTDTAGNQECTTR